MKKMMMCIAATVAACAAFAWPRQDEVVKAKPIVEELMSSRASLPPGEAADAAAELAAAAKTEAARFLLLRRAVELYAKAGDDENTAAAFKKLILNVKDVPPTVQERILFAAGRTLSVGKRAKTEALFKGVRALVWADKELVAARRALKSTKKDAPEAHLRAGNALAVMGDWPKALAHLLGTNGKIAPVADHEINGTATAAKLADAWWKASTLAEEEYVKSAYRLHAAELYRKALAANLLEGLNKALAEDRIAEVEKENEVDPVANLSDLANQDKVKVGKVQLWEGGPYWAEMNIGATKPEEYGYYFWWGDTVGYKRENHAWVASNGSSANFSFSSENTPTLGKSVDELKSEGWITADGVLAPEHDAAHVHWGGDWRMPTVNEIRVLVESDKCNRTWTTVNGVNGYLVKGKGAYVSASIFLPVAGIGDGNRRKYLNSQGSYWSSIADGNANDAWNFWFDPASLRWSPRSRNRYRAYGLSVRPVQSVAK